MRAAKAGLRRNKDGRYSIKSYLGKEVRTTYETSGCLVKEIDERLEELAGQPRQRWGEFNVIACRSKAFRVSLIGWLGIVLYYVSIAHRDGGLEITLPAVLSFWASAYLDVFWWVTSLGMRRDIPHIVGSAQIIGYSVVSAVAGFLIATAAFHNRGARFSPKPPRVTLENLACQVQGDLMPAGSGNAVASPNTAGKTLNNVQHQTEGRGGVLNPGGGLGGGDGI